MASVRTVRVERRLLDADGRALARVGDDQHHGLRFALGGADLTHWRELTVELLDGDHDLLAAVSSSLYDAGLATASTVKLDRVLGHDHVSVIDLRKPPADGTVGALLATRLRDGISLLIEQDWALRTDGPDAVHDMRVAVRRLRSDLAIWRPFLDPAAHRPGAPGAVLARQAARPPVRRRDARSPTGRKRPPPSRRGGRRSGGGPDRARAAGVHGRRRRAVDDRDRERALLRAPRRCSSRSPTTRPSRCGPRRTPRRRSPRGSRRPSSASTGPPKRSTRPRRRRSATTVSTRCARPLDGSGQAARAVEPHVRPAGPAVGDPHDRPPGPARRAPGQRRRAAGAPGHRGRRPRRRRERLHLRHPPRHRSATGARRPSRRSRRPVARSARRGSAAGCHA